MSSARFIETALALRARVEAALAKAAELRARAPSIGAPVGKELLLLATQYDDLAQHLGKLASHYERAARIASQP